MVEKPKNKKSLLWVVFIGVAVILFMLAFSLGKTTMINPNEMQIQNVFADVNGDGVLDLIVSAKVILNRGQINFP